MSVKIPPPKGKGEPPSPGNTMGNLDAQEQKELVALNFKVQEAVRTDFKITAAQEGMNMVELFYESFALFKREKTK